MAWQRVIIQTNADVAEPLADALLATGALSVSFEGTNHDALFQDQPHEFVLWEKVTLTVLFSGSQNISSIISGAAKTCELATQLTYRQEPLADQDWVRVTQQHFQPLCFGEKLWVCPSHCDPTSLTGTLVTIDPGVAFGTGSHATTALCLEWLTQHPPKNQTVIDYGCGSGVLALAAIALNAKSVIAVDNDQQALEATASNASLNTNKEKLTVGFPDIVANCKADLVIANILANPLIALAPKLTSLVETRGTLILSGILTNEIERLLSAYQPEFKLVQTTTREEWALLEIKKGPQ